MRLLVVRHAIAREREPWARVGLPDDERPLTEEGRRKMGRAAGGLCTIAPVPDVLATSPLVRAKQTAEIVARAFALAERAIVATDALRPDAPFDGFVAWVNELEVARDGIVAVVGHEPHLGGLATWLMTGSTDSRLELKKGAACLLQFDGAPRVGGATLLWSAPPSLLRRIVV